MKLVIDTSILIDHLRGGLLWKNLLDEIEEKNSELFVPTIVLFELFSGRSTRQSTASVKINKLLRDFQRIELTEEIAKRAGELYRDIKKTLQVPDYIIAASALEMGGIVVTLNRKHFEQIPHLALYPMNSG